MRLLFSGTLFLCAALLFWVQPMISKMLLPLLGGTPAVWNTCLVFFQTALLGGYLYAYLTSRWLKVRQQALLHILIFWGIFCAMSFNFEDLLPDHYWPKIWLFRILTLSIGAPFFVLAATAPLLQRWFNSTNHPEAHNPYFLYAGSNAGSVLALLSYPFLIEPFLRLKTQNTFWIIGSEIALVLLVLCAFVMAKNPGTQSSRLPPEFPGKQKIRHPQWRWLLLAFVPSSLLLSVTNHIATDIAATPLFWVIPLCLYLLTFMLVFSRKPVLRHEWMLSAQTFLILPPLLLYVGKLETEVWLAFPVHLLIFFVFAMVCHGELVRYAPQPARLTEFYLWMAVGGVLGGIFTALLAPHIFNTILEYPLMLILACVLRPGCSTRFQRRTLYGLAFGIAVAFVLLPISFVLGNRESALLSGTLSLILISSCLGALSFEFLNTPQRVAWGLGTFFAVILLLTAFHNPVLLRHRNFFGTLKVTRNAQQPLNVLYHGTTVHGAQHTTPDLRREPLTYFHRKGPLGQIFANFQTEAAQTFAVFGLGVGTIATYMQAEDTLTFYEIDPEVEQVARNEQWFTYLRDCPGEVHVILGDARFSVASASDASYDFIIQDAFSSDRVPVHLLTKEAFSLYKTKLRTHGLLIFNISNRYLDLEPVLANLIADAGMVGLIRRDTYTSQEGSRLQHSSSVWIAAARNAEELGLLQQTDALWKRLRTHPDERLWTDDYSNILSVLDF